MTTTRDLINRAAPPEWTNTVHGDRAMGRVLEFVRSAPLGLLPAPSPFDLPSNVIFTPINLARWLDSLAATGLSPASRNRALSAVLKVWRRAHRRGLLDFPPPAGLYEREPKGRRRVLSPEEEPKLLAALAEPYRSLARFLLYSGLRVSEALALTWADVKAIPLGIEVTVRNSKNGDPRAVPVLWTGCWRYYEAAMSVGRPTRLGPYSQVSQAAFNHAWAAARASMGLAGDPEFVPHMLRHTYATRLVVAGVPLSVVARLLGHRSIRTTFRYQHVSDKDAEQWVRKVHGSGS